MGLGKFGDLRGGSTRKRGGGVFLRGLDTPIHTMGMHAIY